MSKKDKEKRKKGDSAREPASAWMADLRPLRAQGERGHRASTPSPPANLDAEDARVPATRRSSPLPDDLGEDVLDTPIPRLRPLTIDPPAVDDSVDEEGEDIAPVGPTGYAGGFGALSPFEMGETPHPPRPSG